MLPSQKIACWALIYSSLNWAFNYCRTTLVPVPESGMALAFKINIVYTAVAKFWTESTYRILSSHRAIAIDKYFRNGSLKNIHCIFIIDGGQTLS
jgi:hypothetical protein